MTELTEKTQEKVKVWHAFEQSCSKVVAALAQDMQEAQNLPLTWYNVLFHLNSDPRGGMRLQDLAEAVDLSQSGLTRLLDRMAEAELINREPCPYDRRGAYAIITTEGKTVLEQATPVYLCSIDTHFLQHLNNEESEVVQRVCAKIFDADAEA